MKKLQRQDGAIMWEAETPEESEELRKMAARPSKYGNYMKPHAQYVSVKDNPGRNRARTRGRRFDIVPVFRTIGSPLQGMSPIKVPTRSFRKICHPPCL